MRFASTGNRCSTSAVIAFAAFKLTSHGPLRELFDPAIMYPYFSAAAWYRSTARRPRPPASNARMMLHLRTGVKRDGRYSE